MSVQKPVRFLYQSKNKTTGLTDVKAQIYLNGVAKAVGTNAVVLTELDATNSPGLYELLLTATVLTGYGVIAGQTNVLEGYIDSATQPAAAPFREELTVANSDDLEADITSVKTDTSAIRVDLETATSSLPNILAAINSIKNNAGFSIPIPSQLAKPSSGANVYRVPVSIYNESNALIDPDSNSIVVTLVNVSGTDRSSYLTGASGGSAPMVRDSLGQYHIDVTLTSSAVDEELLFKFSYSIGGAATARTSTTVVVDAISVAGLAQQSTLLSVQTTVNSIQSEVTDATNGLIAINSNVTGARSQITGVSSQVTALQSDVTNNVEGSGFVAGSDSLHQISTFLRANLYTGGRAV
jgi:hypothetical protein